MEIKAVEGLNFSKHAAKRVIERGIATEGQFKNVLEHAVDEARKKGAKDLAVIGSQAVFFFFLSKNVGVTVMSREDMKDRIFTNIDSAVLIPK